MGDFNAVWRPDERLNLNFCPWTVVAFNKFIYDAGILKLNMGWRRYTYFCDDGCKLSKLDRILVCPNFLAAFPLTSIFDIP